MQIITNSQVSSRSGAANADAQCRGAARKWSTWQSHWSWPRKVSGNGMPSAAVTTARTGISTTWSVPGDSIRVSCGWFQPNIFNIIPEIWFCLLDLFKIHNGICKKNKNPCPASLKTSFSAASPVCGSNGKAYINYQAMLCAAARIQPGEDRRRREPWESRYSMKCIFQHSLSLSLPFSHFQGWRIDMRVLVSKDTSPERDELNRNPPTTQFTLLLLIEVFILYIWS